MPVEATFERRQLFRLLRKPGLTDREVALALTKHNVNVRGMNVAVTPMAVKKAKQRYRPQLEAMGRHARGKGALIAELQRRTGHSSFPSEQHYNSSILKYLRLKDRQEAGRPSARPKDRSGLASWEQGLRDDKYVVDVTPDGVPYTRPAMPDELVNGQLRPGGRGLLTAGK